MDKSWSVYWEVGEFRGASHHLTKEEADKKFEELLLDEKNVHIRMTHHHVRSARLKY